MTYTAIDSGASQQMTFPFTYDQCSEFINRKLQYQLSYHSALCPPSAAVAPLFSCGVIRTALPLSRATVGIQILESTLVEFQKRLW
jgi:hypothetical protein